MKKLIAIAGCAILAACSQGEAPAEQETVVAAEEAPAEDSMAGSYDVTASDGSVSTTTIDADGNYVTTSADGTETERGTMVQTNGQTCFNSAVEGSAPDCWTDGEPAADGSWVATSDAGETVTVMKRP